MTLTLIFEVPQELWSKDNFTVLCSVTWPLNDSEAGGDLVSTLLLLCKSSCYNANWVLLHYKSREVCIKARSTLASLPFKGHVTEQRTERPWERGRLRSSLFSSSFSSLHSVLLDTSCVSRTLTCNSFFRLACALYNPSWK